MVLCNGQIQVYESSEDRFNYVTLTELQNSVICSPDLRSVVIGRVCDKTSASSQLRHLVTKDECSAANDITILIFFKLCFC